MPIVKVKEKAQITLPAKMRRKLGIKEGDYLEASVDKNKIILVPQLLVGKFAEVTLSAKGEEMLSEALDDVRVGRVTKYEDADALIRGLHREANSD